MVYYHTTTSPSVKITGAPKSRPCLSDGMRIIHRSQMTTRISRRPITEIAIQDLETETGGTGASATTILKVSARKEALETDPVSTTGHNEEIEAKVTMEANVDGIGGIQALARSRVLSSPCTEDYNLNPIYQILQACHSQNSATYPAMNLQLTDLVQGATRIWRICLVARAHTSFARWLPQRNAAIA